MLLQCKHKCDINAHQFLSKLNEIKRASTMESDSFTGIRTYGESDRPPEFKTERNQLLRGIDEFLAAKAEAQASGAPIADTPRIVTTELGSVRHGQMTMGVESRIGEALFTDPQTGAPRYERVYQDPEGKLSSTVVVGTSPFYGQVGREFAPGNNEVYGSFHRELIDGGGTLEVVGGSVCGDGGVRQEGLNGRVHTSRELMRADDVAMLRTIFGTSTYGPNL
jgi:hypothetical protein